jgi:hypothetical protein
MQSTPTTGIKELPVTITLQVRTMPPSVPVIGAWQLYEYVSSEAADL